MFSVINKLTGIPLEEPWPPRFAVRRTAGRRGRTGVSAQLRALVTGASSGSGAAYARALRARGNVASNEEVQASLRGLDRGALRVVTGWTNRLAVFAQRFALLLPRRVAAASYRPSPRPEPPA